MKRHFVILLIVILTIISILPAYSQYGPGTDAEGSKVEKSPELLAVEQELGFVFPADTKMAKGQFGGSMLIFSDSNEANKIIGKGIEIGYETQNGFYKLPDDFKG